MPLRDPTHMAQLFALLHRHPAVEYPDEALNQAWNYALLLEEEEETIPAASPYSLRDVLYGRYYWYTKFLARYEALYGRDGGMEQAQFHIIEAMDAAGVVDSDTLEAIERELSYTDPPLEL